MDQGFVFFLKVIATPISIALAISILETATTLVRGRGKGEQKYRAWEQEPGANSEPRPLTHQTLQTIRRNRKVVDVEQMASLSISEHRKLGIELVVGAFAVDLLNPVKMQDRVIPYQFMFSAHIMMLAAIVLSNILAEQTINAQSRRLYSSVSILLGTLAMATAFMGLEIVNSVIGTGSE